MTTSQKPLTRDELRKTYRRVRHVDSEDGAYLQFINDRWENEDGVPVSAPLFNVVEDWEYFTDPPESVTISLWIKVPSWLTAKKVKDRAVFDFEVNSSLILSEGYEVKRCKVTFEIPSGISNDWVSNDQG